MGKLILAAVYMCLCLLAADAGGTLMAPLLAQETAPRGTAAALIEVDRLRKDNAQLRAMLIGRDQLLERCRYESSTETARLRADLASAKLSDQANGLLPTLRQLFGVTDETRSFDWAKGEFVPAKPAKTTGE